MTKRLVRKVKQVLFHRNGVGGEGFFTVLFSGTGRGEKEMLATVFDSTMGLNKEWADSESIRVSVINVDELRNGKIERKYSGDDYNNEILSAIKDYQKELDNKIRMEKDK